MNKPLDTRQSDASIASILSAHRGETHLIVIHDYPDPDAIASACAHKLISSIFDIETDIIYRGRVSHSQNIALLRLLEIELIKYEGQLYDSQVKHKIFTKIGVPFEPESEDDAC
ncbi:MAG: hypothetical protein M5U34_05555 [Chloroflexi bacterium]|nr:hypothetical protein [Chloroflexota bacterium]